MNLEAYLLIETKRKQNSKIFCTLFFSKKNLRLLKLFFYFYLVNLRSKETTK